MDLGLKDKVAIVAASSSGLGLACARALAAEGAKLAMCSRDEIRIYEAAEPLHREFGTELLTMDLDVTDDEHVRKFVNATIERFGRLDICIANSGGPPSKKFDQTTIDDWEEALRQNFLSTLYFAQAALPPMRKQRWGRFIAITSASVKQPLDGLILSNSVRSAVSGLIKSLSIECGPDNVLVHNVCPGFTATDRLMNLATATAEREGIPIDAVVERWSSQTALKRVGTPEEFANVVAFLCSERASYLTGSAIAIDGGLVKGVFS